MLFRSSATAWATAVPTSRAKASVAWVVLMTGPPLVRPLLPTAFVGRPLVHPDASGVALAAALWLALGVTTASLAVRHIVRSGFPLEAAQ